MRLLLVAILLAGCAQLPAPVVDDPATSCPVAKPDGGPGCDHAGFVPAQAGRPSPLDGWRCVNSWRGQGQYAETYADLEGNIAFYWEWERNKPDGAALQRLAWYDAVGKGRSLHADYQPAGHLVMAPQSSGPYEIHLSLRQMRAHAFIDDEWIQPQDVSFEIDSYQGDMWWTVRFDWDGGPYFVSTMKEEPDEESFAVWSGSAWTGDVAGVPVIIDYQTGGVKQLGPAYDGWPTRVDPCVIRTG